MDDKEQYSGVWEKEEFEDLVAHALIGLYETEQHKSNKQVPKEVRVSDKEMQRIRTFGAWFYPDDRIMLDECSIDMKNDYLPNQAALSSANTKNTSCHSFDFLSTAYFGMDYMEKVANLPGGIKSENRFRPSIKETFYSLIILNATAKEKLHVQKTFVSVDNKTGQIYDTLFYNPEIRQFAKATQAHRKDLDTTPTDTLISSAILNFHLDSRFLWNVTAKEGVARATFGVHPEQIKSLFYSREMPMTETGRKRPILHWVAAHHRRIKNGIDINIEKYLRGINEFVYNGTKFIITRPFKGR